MLMIPLLSVLNWNNRWKKKLLVNSSYNYFILFDAQWKITASMPCKSCTVLMFGLFIGSYMSLVESLHFGTPFPTLIEGALVVTSVGLSVGLGFYHMLNVFQGVWASENYPSTLVGFLRFLLVCWLYSSWRKLWWVSAVSLMFFWF